MDAPRTRSLEATEEHGDKREFDDATSSKNTGSDLHDSTLQHGSDTNGAAPLPKQEPNNEIDPNAVDWDGPDDQENPKNWPESTQMLNVAILALLTIVTYVFPPSHRLQMNYTDKTKVRLGHPCLLRPFQL